MPDDSLNASWTQARHQSYEDLKKEADAKKARRENLQPLTLGKQNYGSVFKIGDRTRPELALSLTKPDHVDDLGSGQVSLEDLIPTRAFRDLDHALAQANVTAQEETQEGIRETITYDADEAEIMTWQEIGARMSLVPPAEEKVSSEAESGAFEVDNAAENGKQ